MIKHCRAKIRVYAYSHDFICVIIIFVPLHIENIFIHLITFFKQGFNGHFCQD